MSKVETETRTNFFPGKKNINSSPIKNSPQVAIPPRNDPERQNEIRTKTEKDAQVNIPEKIKDFARIKRAVDMAPEMDNSEKVSKLKEQIDSGNYQIDYEGLAERMLSNEF